MSESVRAIPESTAKEWISLAYIDAISAQAGLNISTWRWDDGIDVEVGSSKLLFGNWRLPTARRGTPMSNGSRFDAVLAGIAPTDVRRFLTKRGYRYEGGREETGWVYIGPDREGLLVPGDQGSYEYVRRLRALFDVLAGDELSHDDLVACIVLADPDIFRYRIESAEAAWGHLRLQYSHSTMHALFDAIKYTAAGVSSRRADYRRVSDSAESFAQQCRFGQTEYGSFVLKIFCPTTVVSVSQADEISEPFGRTATRALFENFEFLSSDRADDPTEPLPPTLNRQVASAVERLRPATPLFSDASLQLLFTPLPAASLEQRVAGYKQENLSLGPFIYGRAQSVRDRLKKAEEFGRELLRGFIVNLHKDRPTSTGEQSHEVSLDVKFGLSRRIVRLRLMPDQYKRAVRWHDANLEVDLDAVIDKRSQVWSVFQLHDIRPTQKNDGSASLF